MRTERLHSVAVALAWLLLPGPALGQYLFGQNKVVYDTHAWEVISTPHLDVYYYSEETALATTLADFAERTCAEYDVLFRHQMRQKIPLILYASHHDFKQTNVVDLLLSDDVGGFTEFLRGRVAVPYTGSLSQLRTVTRHELVHAYVNDKLGAIENERHRYDMGQPPLWFMEGIAEYIAGPEPDTEARMFLRDVVTNDLLVEIPDLWRIAGTFLMYKEGESLVGYLATRFGTAALVQLVENWWISDRFEVVLERTLGMSVAELNRDWKRYLLRRYAPAVLDQEWPEQQGEALTRSRGIHSRPVPAPDPSRAEGADDFVLLSSDSGTLDLVYARALGRGPDGHARFDFEPLVRGGREDRFESFPAFTSGPAIHERQMAFTCKAGPRDALVLWDLDRRREIRRYQFADLMALASPSWSPDGCEIVLAGLDRSGWSDLYRVQLADGEIIRLTQDAADDRDPAWSHDGTRIAWASDRGVQEMTGVTHLWLLDLGSGVLQELTAGTHADAAPRWAADDAALLFTSDASGTYDAYRLDLGDRSVTRLTTTLGGIFTPQWTPDGSGFLAASFGEQAFNIYRFALAEPPPAPPGDVMPRPAVALAVVNPPGRSVLQPRVTADDGPGEARHHPASYPSRDYGVRFGLDFVRTAVAFDPDFRSAAGGQLGFSDMLGNHQIAIYASNSAASFTDFWRHLDCGVTYTNLSQRLNYSLGIFHLTSEYDPHTDRFRYERRYGVLGGLAYPLSRFRRLESTLVLRIAEREESEATIFGVGPRSFLVSNYTAFVHDNTLWTATGPLEGTRFNLTLGQTFDLTGTHRRGTSAQVDLRTYRPVPGRTVLAGRVAARGSWGPDVQYSYLGGPFDLRGYRLRSLFARRTVLMNGEVRFPLVDRLLIGLPFHALEFGGFRGALFGDTAYVGVPYASLYGSFGVGFEMWLGPGFVARLDVGRTHDFHSLDDDTFSHFFIGWDY